MIFSMLVGTISGDVTRFSTASTTPSGVCMPIAVDPSCSANNTVLQTLQQTKTTTTIIIQHSSTDFAANKNNNNNNNTTKIQRFNAILISETFVEAGDAPKL